MTVAAFLKKISNFKILVFVVLIMLCLSEYYVAFSNFNYAAKKEDSPANLNAAVVKGVIHLAFSIAATLFLIWLFVQPW